ncbi:MAG TPA: ABC transporter ATP-binding protein [Acetobacteraceae bacterium]|nr:ABC transporter ATP-binding protein [Acetobacteraceae bacterium]
MPDPLLDVRNLRVHFHTADGLARAVEDVSIRIYPNETMVLIGESGAGKSVTGLAAMGLIPRGPGTEISGEIIFRGRDGQARDLTRLSASALRRIRGNEIAMVFQEPMSCLNPVYTVGNQIADAVMLHQGRRRAEALDIAEQMLERLGIPDPRARLNAYPHEISGGMAQRVMIAMALSCRPALLIADEPTTALDVTVQAQLLELIKALQTEIGMAVLFITHNLGVAAEIADRIAVMYAGRVVEEADAAAIFAAPRMPYTAGLLASVPRLVLDDREMRLTAIPGEVPSPLYHPKGCAFHPRCPHFEPGLCDSAVPPLEPCGAGHHVRCVRWRALAGEPVA